MKKISKILLTVFLVIIAVFVSTAFFSADLFYTGETVDLSTYNQAQDNVSFHNLYIEATANDDNTIFVTETFDVTFNMFGLSEVVRLIPYATNTVREDNEGNITKSLLYAKITDVSGSGDGVVACNLYEDEIEGCLTVGLKADSYVPVGTTRSYVINYTYHMGKDNNKGFDDIYFNLVGVSSLLTIDNVSFKVTLPKEVEAADRIQMYKGKYGSTDSMEFSVSGNVITGSCEKLNPLEGITFWAVYEDGYLKYENVVSGYAIAAIVIAVTILAMAVVGFICFKQRKKPLEPVELIVPEGLTPLKAEFYDTSKCSGKGIVGSLIALANKGYMKINERNDKEIELIKDKEMLDTEDYSLKALYRALFTGRDMVLVSQLEKDTGFADSQIAITTAEKAKSENSLYDKKAKKNLSSIKAGMSFFTIVIGILMVLTTVSYFGFFSSVLTFRLIVIFGLIVGLVITMFTAKRTYIPSIVISGLLILFMLMFYLRSGYSVFDSYYLVFVAVCITAVADVLICGEEKYAKSGSLKKGRAMGFKNFIKMCEVEQIKAFALENPSYYFDVLPYAYVFGLSGVWISKFEGITITPPTWATSDGNWVSDVIIFNSMYRRFSVATYTASRRVFANHTFSTVSSSSGGGRSFGGGGGGSFGGGGFSGGGGGGGGFGAR